MVHKHSIHDEMAIPLSKNAKRNMEEWEKIIDRLKGKQRKDAIGAFWDRYKVMPHLSQNFSTYMEDASK